MENTPRRAERSMNVKTVAWCKYFLAELRPPQFQEEIFTITKRLKNDPKDLDAYNWKNITIKIKARPIITI